MHYSRALCISISVCNYRWILCIGTSATAVFRTDVPTTPFAVHIFLLLLLYCLGKSNRTKNARPTDQLKPVQHRTAAAVGCMKLNYRKCRYSCKYLYIIILMILLYYITRSYYYYIIFHFLFS